MQYLYFIIFPVRGLIWILHVAYIWRTGRRWKLTAKLYFSSFSKSEREREHPSTLTHSNIPLIFDFHKSRDYKRYKYKYKYKKNITTNTNISTNTNKKMDTNPNTKKIQMEIKEIQKKRKQVVAGCTQLQKSCCQQKPDNHSSPELQQQDNVTQSLADVM